MIILLYDYLPEYEWLTVEIFGTVKSSKRLKEYFMSKPESNSFNRKIVLKSIMRSFMTAKAVDSVCNELTYITSIDYAKRERIEKELTDILYLVDEVNIKALYSINVMKAFNKEMTMKEIIDFNRNSFSKTTMVCQKK